MDADLPDVVRNDVVGGPLRLYGDVDELIVRPPLEVDGSTPVEQVAARMTEAGVAYAAVRGSGGGLGLITDSLLRSRVIVAGRPLSTPVAEVMLPDPPVVRLGASAAEALILMLERDAECVLVTDRAGRLRGVLIPRDFAVSSALAGVSVNEQLRRTGSIDELVRRARGVPDMLGELMAHGLASSKVVAVYSTVLDTLVRRAVELILGRHSELSPTAFTWLCLGSTGRREATLSSDVDSAAWLADGLTADEVAGYRRAFGEVYRVLGEAGLSGDRHGATAAYEPFARTRTQWAEAVRHWLAAPERDEGAIMTSLLLDGRAIVGDQAEPAALTVLAELRNHPGTLRMLLRHALAARARLWSMRDVVSGRADSYDLKAHALLPLVNLARWAALSVGSMELSTIERLQAAAGSPMLTEERSRTLVEVFEVLQRVRLRHQLAERRAGERPTDVFVRDRMSPLDRSVIAQAVREIAVAQRRMDNVSLYVPAEEWALREPRRG